MQTAEVEKRFESLCLLYNVEEGSEKWDLWSYVLCEHSDLIEYLISIYPVAKELFDDSHITLYSDCPYLGGTEFGVVLSVTPKQDADLEVVVKRFNEFSQTYIINSGFRGKLFSGLLVI